MTFNQQSKGTTIEEHKFDIFFIYKTNPETSSWVKETCRDLERIHIVAGYYEKDFLPGRQIPKNITTCLNQSKHVGVVITPEFGDSRWCSYELNAAMKKVIKSRESQIILPLFLNITDIEKEVPEELQMYVGLDVTGHREQWWDKLVSAIKGTTQGDVQTIHYYLQKLIEAMNDVTIDTATRSADIMSISPLGPVEQQIGRSCVQKILLSSCGIEFENMSVKFDFAKLVPSGEGTSKICSMQSVFNEVCSERSLLAFMNSSRNEEIQTPFRSQCEMKFYGFDEMDYIKLSLAFADPQEIHFNYNKRKILTLSNENTTNTVKRLSESRCAIHLRSKRSQRIREWFPTQRVPRHNSRGCKNYRNYRKVFFRFPDMRLSGRYTFRRDNYRITNPDRHAQQVEDSVTFLLVQKFDHSQKALVF